MDRYLAVQRRAANLYEQLGGEHVFYFQSEHDPCEWMELHQYPSEGVCRATAEKLGRQPEVIALWEQFQSTLDPHYPLQVDEYQQRGWPSVEQVNNLFEDELHELLPDEPRRRA